MLFVVDSSDKQRMHEAKIELSDLLKEEQLKGAALVVLANKQASDLKGELVRIWLVD